MDTIDLSDSQVPARFSPNALRTPAPVSMAPRDLAPPPTAQISSQLLLRGLSRHWWRILLLWLGISTPLAYLIYTLVEPTYEAFSLLQIEPTTPDLFGKNQDSSGDNRAAQPYLLTQVQLIRSDKVLDAAISTDPRILNLKMIKTSTDPKVSLRNAMLVEIVAGNTFLIRVALSSKDPVEAAAIVNAVVDAYVEQHVVYHRTANKALDASLKEELKLLEEKIAAKKNEFKKLVETGHVPMGRPTVKSTPVGDDDSGTQTALGSVTAEQYTQAANALLQTELELIEGQAELEAAQGQLTKTTSTEGQEQVNQAADLLKERIEAEFKKDPDAVALIAEIEDAKEQLEKVADVARQKNDPARVAIDRRLRKLRAEWATLWNQRYEEIGQRLAAENLVAQPDVWQQKVAELQVKISMLKRKRLSLTDRLNTLKVEATDANSDTFSASVVNQELASLWRMEEIVAQKLEQLHFESKRDIYRISLNDRAAVPKIPSNNKRIKLMAAVPVVVLFVMLGLFMLMEIKSERVADPESLSLRMQSEVYALPPLPTARSLRRQNALNADDQIEQFIQRLDHLRFAVCGNPTELDQGRCVLITSAIGREGKTTLAAQLAARCGNAGMSTLLIDADMRRTGLCSLLDIPEGRGLSDALLHEDLVPSDLVIPVQGGTFHLLPAGTPIPDVSRALQNRKLGLLITQFRQIYDLVIIDSAPVLPVPDALILGRWADGAVLAVRYDISRFPQVERARRQLDGAGINVLGTVINGMRNSETYHGRYSYSRRSSSQTEADPAAAL